MSDEKKEAMTFEDGQEAYEILQMHMQEVPPRLVAAWTVLDRAFDANHRKAIEQARRIADLERERDEWQTRAKCAAKAIEEIRRERDELKARADTWWQRWQQEYSRRIDDLRALAALRARIEGAEKAWIEWDAFPNPLRISRVEFQASNPDNDVVEYLAIPVEAEERCRPTTNEIDAFADGYRMAFFEQSGATAFQSEVDEVAKKWVEGFPKRLKRRAVEREGTVEAEERKECTRCEKLSEVKVDWPELHLCDDCTNDEINEKGK